MRKDMYRRSKDVDVNETPEENGDPLSGSSDPFDALVNSKPNDDTASKSNGKTGPSPVPDDSDGENDAETSKNNDEKSETNGADSADSADAKEDDEGYEVEDIVGHKFKGKKKLFKIRWKNYDESQDTWEPEEDLSCPEIIERYLEEHPEAKGPKPAKEKKVRISLPPAESSRSTPKRTAAERKTIVDDPASDSDESDKKKSPSKRGRPKKNSAGAKSSAKKNTEYEVQKIIDDEMRGGKKYYRIRWKGWSAKDDTWEPKSSLSCPEIIKAYENSKKSDDEEYEVEKIVGEKIEYGVRYFLVKWKGWPESDNTWEEEKSVDCYDLIEKFRNSCHSASKSNKRPAKTSPKAKPKAKKARKNVSEDEDNDNDDDDDDDEEEEPEKEWEVEKVVNQRTGKGGKKLFLIRWKGCKASDDTWEPEDGINCPELIAAFLKKNKK